MGLGEVGGDGSVQVSVYIPGPVAGETEAGEGRAIWDRARAKDQLSEKAARINPVTGEHAYRGQDTQRGMIDKVGPGDFTVTVNFGNGGEVAAALTAFNAAATNGQLTVVFRLGIRNKTAGQIQIEWPS